MDAGVAWVLNLDADVELAGQGGAAYTPKRGLERTMRPHVERLRRRLLGLADVLVDAQPSQNAPLEARGLVGRAFSPTPYAIALLQRAGAVPEAHPPLEVLRRVNSRAFASSLGPTLPGACFVTDVDTAEALLRRLPELGSAWRVKHAFGMAGRNQRVAARSPDARDLAFVRHGIAAGGVQIEPNVDIEREYAMHAFLLPNGRFIGGALVRQVCDARGAWVLSERVDREEACNIRIRLEDEVTRVAHALASAGYFGPFGVDAYSYVAPDGALGFQPRSEINARYSMGFPIGFGAPPSPLR